MVLVGLVLAAVAWNVAVFGMAGLMPVAVLVATILVLFFAFLRKFPGITAASFAVLLVPPIQVIELFAYELFLAGAFVVLWFIGWRSRSSWLGQLSWLEVFVLAQLAWGVFTIFWSPEWWWWLFGVRVYVMGFLALWIALRVSRFVDGEILLAGIPAGACALGLATIGQAVRTGYFQAPDVAHMRTTATDVGWGVSNYLAALVALMLPTGIYLAMNARRRFVRLLGWASIPLSTIPVTFGASRGGAVLLLVIAVFSIFRLRIKPWIAIASAVLLVGLLFAGRGGSLLMSRFTSEENAYSVVTRLISYRGAWIRTVDHWPFGMGLKQGLMAVDRMGREDPHNYWLTLSSELGLVGIVLWALICSRLWMAIWRLVRDPATENAGRALLLTFIVVQLNILFEPTMIALQYQALFYWVFGIYLGSFDRGARLGPGARGPAAVGVPDVEGSPPSRDEEVDAVASRTRPSRNPRGSRSPGTSA